MYRLALASLALFALLVTSLRADEPKSAVRPPAIDPKDVRVGPPPELARLRKAVDDAARKGENVEEIRKELDALEKALTGKAWIPAKLDEPTGEPVFLASLVTQGQFPHEVSGAYGPFTLKGPKESALKPLPKDLRHLTFDPVGKKHYGISNHAVFEVDLDQGTKTEMKLPANLEKLSWTCGITFDTKRERVLVATLGGVGYLYSYTPKTDTWAVICDLNNVDLAALTYDPKSDRTYGLAESFGGNRTLTVGVRNAAGAVVSTIELKDPAIPKLQRGPVGPPVQLAIVGGDLLIITDKQIVAMDLKTEKVRVTWERK